jgi:hypothetical protein
LATREPSDQDTEQRPLRLPEIRQSKIDETQFAKFISRILFCNLDVAEEPSKIPAEDRPLESAHPGACTLVSDSLAPSAPTDPTFAGLI